MKRLAIVLMLSFAALGVAACDNYFVGCGFSRAKCN